MIFRIPFFLPWLYPGLIWRMPDLENTIYLTFDDGPMPGPTQFVLEELSKANARATFFCIGDNVLKYPEIFQKVIDQGHSIGNHTHNHVKGWSCSTDEYTQNIALCESAFSGNDAFRNSGSPGNKLFRPPYGRINRRQIKALPAYKIIMWDVLTFDYASNFSGERCLAGSIRAARPGSILVFHDSLKAEKNLKYVLPRLLRHFAGLGYSFKAIPNS